MRGRPRNVISSEMLMRVSRDLHIQGTNSLSYESALPFYFGSRGMKTGADCVALNVPAFSTSSIPSIERHSELKQKPLVQRVA